MKPSEGLYSVVQSCGAPTLLLEPADDVEVQLGRECSLFFKKRLFLSKMS